MHLKDMSVQLLVTTLQVMSAALGPDAHLVCLTLTTDKDYRKRMARRLINGARKIHGRAPLRKDDKRKKVPKT